MGLAVKYNTGDRVVIVNERTINMNWDGEMDKYLGTVMTIVGHKEGYEGITYKMKEDDGQWAWEDSMIREGVKSTFLKSDLKSGMWVTTRGNQSYMVLLGASTASSEVDMLIQTRGGYLLLGDYDDCLRDSDASHYDIMRVYHADSNDFLMSHVDDMSLIYDRQEEEHRVPMTLTEIELELGMKIELVEE